jgi:hypothetical protein
MGGMWDHITPAILQGVATLPNVVQQQRTQQPTLHAFPTGSDVALCGKVKAQHEQATATSYCKRCEHLASSVNHRG